MIKSIPTWKLKKVLKKVPKTKKTFKFKKALLKKVKFINSIGLMAEGFYYWISRRNN